MNYLRDGQMMKKIIKLLTILLVVFNLQGCVGNKQIIDTTYSYKYAYVKYDDGTCVKYEIETWSDYSESDAVSIVTTDGQKIYTHLANVVLAAEEK